jgi:TDG/mug DNA glycosylase family protein
VLDDVLTEDLIVVFCGTAVGGDRSGREPGFYGASKNKFWGTLFRTKLTPRQFRPEEYTLVLAHDIGLADLVKKRPSGDVLDDGDYDVEGFRKNVIENRPAIVAFNGKEGAKRCLAKESVQYGRQKAKFEGAIVYVLPSTSDRASDHWDEKHWHELAAEVRQLRKRH